MKRRRRRQLKPPEPLSYAERQVQLAIEKTLAKADGLSTEDFRQELRLAYPFGERKGPRYKIWNRLSNAAIAARETLSS